MHVAKGDLIIFAEAKHMDAYAELLAAFIGLVYERQPKRLSPRRAAAMASWDGHPVPFLHLPGVCMRTAEGMKVTFQNRRLQVAVHDAMRPLVAGA